MKVEINKFEAAKRNIQAAIRMTFDEYDLVPVHTVAAAANGVLWEWAKKKGIETTLDQAWAKIIRPGYEKEVAKFMLRHANFFKHADKDPDSSIELPLAEANDMEILFAISRYQDLTQAATAEMGIFATWMRWCNPDMVMPFYKAEPRSLSE